MPNLALNPLVVATVSTKGDLGKLERDEIQPACDCLEFRLDSLASAGLLDRAETSILKGYAPALITARHPAEGGDGELGASEREALYRRYLDLAWAMDIEIRSLPELSDLVADIKTNKPLMVASFHDFENLPETEFLLEKIGEGVAGGADVVKIAARLHSQDDLVRLVSLLEGEERIPLSVMGMGSLGTASRLLAAKSGSVLNYGYLTEPNAPGQCPAEMLKRLVAG